MPAERIRLPRELLVSGVTEERTARLCNVRDDSNMVQTTCRAVDVATIAGGDWGWSEAALDDQSCGIHPDPTSISIPSHAAVVGAKRARAFVSIDWTVASSWDGSW